MVRQTSMVLSKLHLSLEGLVIPRDRKCNWWYTFRRLGIVPCRGLLSLHRLYFIYIQSLYCRPGSYSHRAERGRHAEYARGALHSLPKYLTKLTCFQAPGFATVKIRSPILSTPYFDTKTKLYTDKQKVDLWTPKSKLNITFGHIQDLF